MGHDAEEWRRLRSEFIEAAAKYDEYETFIERTSDSEDFYCNNGRYQTVGLIRWPYRPYRKCWILTPDSGEDAEPFSALKTLSGKAWLWLPRDIADEIVETAKTHLSEPPSPPDDRCLWWAKSSYQYWCWLLWFHWLRQHRAANPTEAEKPSKTMVMSPFRCSADLIAQWGLDGSNGAIPEWLTDGVVDQQAASEDIDQSEEPTVVADISLFDSADEAESEAKMDRSRQSNVAEAMVERTVPGRKFDADQEPRLVVSDGKHPQATVDGKPISISKKQAGLLRLLLDAHGEYVSLADHKFRSRDVEGIPDLIREFVETQPGAGTRIPRDKLFAVKDT